jgi:selenium metabolism protein YedF
MRWIKKACSQPKTATTTCSAAGKLQDCVSGIVYVISSDTMGRGNDELGWALLQTYVQTIEKLRPLPSRILLYNAGVRLVAEESAALNALRSLQEQDVEILACGTCLDYFQLKSKMQVGRISNMLEIMSSLASATKVLSPF